MDHDFINNQALIHKQQQYITLKTFLNGYDFSSARTLGQLYSAFNGDISRGLFYKLIKAMGVYSRSVRLSINKVERRYYYDKSKDVYIYEVASDLVKCEKCHGKGFVKTLDVQAANRLKLL